LFYVKPYNENNIGIEEQNSPEENTKGRIKSAQKSHNFLQKSSELNQKSFQQSYYKYDCKDGNLYVSIIIYYINMTQINH
jgi:hypothetical protein